MKTVKRSELATYLNAGYYLRWGHPRGGVSINHITGRPEVGVSACELTYEPWHKYESPAYRADSVWGEYSRYGRFGQSCYLWRGVEVGRGGDNEPCIRGHRVAVIVDDIGWEDDRLWVQCPVPLS